MNLRIAAILVFAAMYGAANAAEEKEPGFTMTVGAREVYDDNLYRLPDNQEPPNLAGQGPTRSDYISRVSLGLEQEWQWSRQTVLIDVKGNHDAYSNNDYLDNTSGEARAKWKWEAGEHWAGEFAGDYKQALASFANTQFLGRDMLETTGASWMLAFRLGPQWSLRAAGRQAATEHSAILRRVDNSDTETASLGLQFTTSSENEFALSYRASSAEFDFEGSLNGQVFDRDFEEHMANFRVHYVFSEKTTFDGNVGYLEREYSDAVSAANPRGTFDGGVWDVALQWDPSIKMRFEFSGWRKLRAYLDAESDYFVADGASVAASWHPTDRLGFVLEAGLEDQDYLGTGVLVAPESRRDRVLSQELRLSYRMLRKLYFDAVGRVEDRDSNRAPLQYDSQVASLGVRWVY